MSKGTVVIDLKAIHELSRKLMIKGPPPPEPEGLSEEDRKIRNDLIDMWFY